MKQTSTPIKTFAALAAEINRRDVEAAQRLAKSAPLRRNRRAGSGPAVAKPR